MEDIFSILLYSIPPMICIIVPVIVLHLRKKKERTPRVLLYLSALALIVTIFNARYAEIYLANKFVTGFRTQSESKQTLMYSRYRSIPNVENKEYEVLVFPDNLHWSLIPYIWLVSYILSLLSGFITFYYSGLNNGWDWFKQKDYLEPEPDE